MSEEKKELDATKTDGVATALVVPPLPKPEILERFSKIQDLKRSLIDPKTDIVSIAGRGFITKSGWRKLAFAFNLTDEIVREEEEQKGNKTIWRMWVRVRAPNGRETIGVASASSDERKFNHPEHDVYALCHTRAKNRGFSDILGLGEVSAEEISADAEAPEAPSEVKEGAITHYEIPAPEVLSPVENEKAPQPSEIPSKSPAQTEWIPKVPLNTAINAYDGIKQYPLIEGVQCLGLINATTDGLELSIVPEHAVLRDCGPIGHLIYKVLEPLKLKYGYEYTVELDQGKAVKYTSSNKERLSDPRETNP